MSSASSTEGVKSGNIQLGGNEFYQALVWYGVPAELVMYPRTIHGFMKMVRTVVAGELSSSDWHCKVKCVPIA
jgi:hypothetical protein